MNKYLRIITDPSYRFDILSSKNILFWLSDEQVLRKKYFYRFHKRLDLENPKTYNEKLQWLKLNDRKDIYTIMVDKSEAKNYIASKIGDQYIIPTLGVWEKFNDINFEELPDQFVLKCTHDSGGLAICRDKRTFNIEKAKKKINKSLKRNYYFVGREWPYKNVKPRIIAEQYLEDESVKELRDYKFFTFSGKPKIVYITQGRFGTGQTTADFYDMDFNHIDLKMEHDNAQIPPYQPENFELMKQLAAVLSSGIPQLRVDFYEVNGCVYVGELTFFHCSGMAPVTPKVWEEKLTEWLQLPEKKN